MSPWPSSVAALYAERPLGPPILAEQVLAGAEDAVVPALDRGRGLGGAGLQVGEVGLAEGAFDDVEVERQVGGQLGVHGVEQVAAQLLAGRAGQTLPAPDGAQGVQAGLAPVLAHVLEPGAEL